MTLAHPLWLLLALPLLAALLHFHRQRRAARARAVGSLHLWRRVAPPPRRAPPRPRPSAALGLQVLVLALLALALARPTLAPDAGGDVLVLLEAGRAMRAADGGGPGDRFGAAARLASGELRGRAGAVLVGDVPVPLALNRPAPEVRAALRAAQAGDGQPDWDAARRLAQGLRAGRTIVYASPGGAPGARAAFRPLRAEVRVIGLGAPNAAIGALDVRPGVGGAPWVLSGRVQNFGPDAPRRLEVTLAGRRLATLPLALAADAATPFRLRFTPGAGGVLEVRLDAGDVLGADDGAALVLRPDPAPLRVAVLGPAAPDSAALRGAAALPGARVAVVGDMPEEAPDLLIVTDPKRIPGGAPPQGPVTLWLNAVGGVPDTVQGWDPADGLGQGVAWGDLGGLRRAPVAAWPSGTALLSGRSGSLIESRTVGGRLEVRVNVPLEGSELARSPAFPVLLANLARLARPDAGLRVAAPCRVGLPCALAAGTRELRGPDGGALPTSTPFVPGRAGVYRAGGQRVAVVRFAGPDADLRGAGEDGPGAMRAAPDGRALLAAAWRPLLALALLALAAEFLLLRRAEPSLRRRNPPARQRRLVALHALAAALLLLAVLDAPLPQPRQRGAEAWIVPPGAPPQAGARTVWGGESPALTAPESGPPGDLAAALEVAAALLRADAPRTLRVRPGAWPASARLPGVLAGLRGRGVHVVLDGPAAPSALALPTVDTPAEVEVGQDFTAQLVIKAPQAGPARLEVRRGDAAVRSAAITLRAGPNRLALPLREAAPGLAGYTVTVRQGRAAAQAHAATRVRAPGAVLVIGPDAAARRAVARALAVQGLPARDLAPGALAADLLAGARRAVLLDTPAAALAPDLRSALAAWVRGGGHLLIAGGQAAFGPGGYVGTPLETLSPLSGRVERDLPRLALGLALDKSGSMNEPVGGGVTKLDLIKSAALNSALLLSPGSDVAVVAFDSSPKLAVPLTRAGDRAALRAGIGRIEAEGGTVVKRALEATLKELQKSGAPRKHLILLTDGVDGGIFSPEEYGRLARRIRATGITLSTVSVGSGMHVPLMRDLARWGGGAFALARDWRDVPSLLARDTLAQGESAARTGTFAARTADGVPFAVRRYVRTTLRPGARALGRVGGDPLAAAWRVGLGSVAALALNPADAGVSLTRRPDFPARLAELSRGEVGADDAEVTLTRDGADLVLSAPTPALVLSGPNGAQAVNLQPAGDGTFVGRRYAPPPGGYSVPGAAVGVPAVPTSDAALRALLADETISGPEWAWRPVYPVWVLLSLLAFFAALALRYLPGRVGRARETALETGAT